MQYQITSRIVILVRCYLSDFDLVSGWRLAQGSITSSWRSVSSNPSTLPVTDTGTDCKPWTGGFPLITALHIKY